MAEFVGAGQLASSAPIERSTPIRPSAWELDFATGLLWASDDVNLDAGLEPGKPHPNELYRALLHPDDAAMTDRVFSDAIESRAQYWSSSHRVVLRSGIQSCHTFGEMIYEGEKLVTCKAHAVYFPSPQLISMVTLGLWTLDRQFDYLETDVAVCQIFDLPQETFTHISVMRERVSPVDYPTFDEFWERVRLDPGAKHDSTCRILKRDSSTVHARLCSRGAAETPITNGTVLATL